MMLAREMPVLAIAELIDEHDTKIWRVIRHYVEEARRSEQKQDTSLKHTRYIWLKNPSNLTVKQSKKLESLSNQNLKTARAYRIKLSLQEFFTLPPDKAEDYLKRWYYWATHSRLKPIIEAAKTIKRHWKGVLNFPLSKLSNGVLEGINGLVQAARARARGYRTTTYFITMIYLIAGKLNV